MLNGGLLTILHRAHFMQVDHSLGWLLILGSVRLVTLEHLRVILLLDQLLHSFVDVSNNFVGYLSFLISHLGSVSTGRRRTLPQMLVQSFVLA